MKQCETPPSNVAGLMRFPPFFPFLFPAVFRSVLIILYIVPMNSESIKYLFSSLYSTVLLPWCWILSLLSFPMLFSKPTTTWSNCCFVPQRHCWKFIIPESVLETHKVSYRSFCFSSNSPAKRLGDAFRLNLNREYLTYLAPWEILLSLSLRGFIQPHRRLCGRTAYICIHTGEADHQDVNGGAGWCGILLNRAGEQLQGYLLRVSSAKKCESFTKW